MNDTTPAPDDSTPDQTPLERPIGFWLRRLDALLDRAFAQALDGTGADRRDWMLLHALERGIPSARGPLRRRMSHLADRGWAVRSDSGAWTLSEDGRTAKDAMSAAVRGIRERVAGAVSPQDYATTMASLEAMAKALGETDAAPSDPLTDPFAPGFRRGHRGHRRGHAGHRHGHHHGGRHGRCADDSERAVS